MKNLPEESRSAKEHIALLLRVQPPASGAPEDSPTRLRALALIKDVLRSRLDVDAAVNAQEWVHAAAFADPGKALAASRALQVAFEGFRSASSAERTHISIMLDASEDAVSVEQRNLLVEAKPAQVLITQSFYNTIAQYQPALRSSSLRTGVYEFLWTSEARMAEIQEEGRWKPALVREPTEPKALDETAVYQTIHPGTRPRWKDSETEPAAPEPEPLFDEDEVPTKRSLNRVVAIATAAVMVLLAGFVMYTSMFSGKHAEPRPPVQPTAVNPLPGSDQPPVTLAPPTPTPPAPAPESLPVAPDPPKPSNPPSNAERPAAASTPRPTRGCSIAGEEPDYLRLADKYRSKGDYERAITNYNLVLGCEPGNRLALTGKRNAEAAEKYASQ